jgi:hypothetical protein
MGGHAVNIEVLDVDLGAGRPVVGFQSPAGIGRGRWMAAAAPQPGDVVQVEFDLPAAVRNWRATTSAAAMLRVDEDDLIVGGVFGGAFDDGVGIMRIGNDILLLDGDDGVPSMPAGTGLELRVEYLDVYPVTP